MTTAGLHHVSIYARDAARTLAFYTGTLGLFLVKQTVNHEDPGVHHLYFGDRTGQPGTLLTFFPYPNIAPGRLGVGETEEIALAVPAASIGFWTHRLLARGVEHEGPVRRFGESVLALRDPDGLRLALVGVADAPASGGDEPGDEGGVPAEHAIAGMRGVTLMVESAGPTAAVLTDVFGFAEAGSEGSLTRFSLGGDGLGSVVDVHAVGGFLKARPGAGSVHHIAFRATDEAAQAQMAQALADRHGLRPTPMKDRTYFRSIYAREPGHILLEIATDGPGMTVDEAPDRLGTALRLPAMFEADRERIVAMLPPLGLAL